MPAFSINPQYEAIMAVSMLPYSVEHYNSLPGLFEARLHYESAQSFDVLSVRAAAREATHNTWKKAVTILSTAGGLLDWNLTV